MSGFEKRELFKIHLHPLVMRFSVLSYPRNIILVALRHTTLSRYISEVVARSCMPQNSTEIRRKRLLCYRKQRQQALNNE